MTEVNMQQLKQRLELCTKRYVENNRNHGRTNLSIEQKEGLRKLKERKKNEEIIIMETDKSKRFSCDTPQNYKLLANVHIRNDEIITHETKQDFEKQINAHTWMWLLILRAGKDVNDSDRIKESMTSHNNTAAPLSILRKDHRVDQYVEVMFRTTKDYPI